MIKSISLTNFQSHKETDLKFSDGVNVIIGQSDSGKTAILRAMNWAINNRPSGDSFRSNWGGPTSVDLEIENKTISREKGKENLYVLSTNTGKHSPEEFKAFGQDTPEEIKNLLNISEINAQWQLDSPFLLTASPGEVARYLNKIVRLDKIDTSLVNIARIIRQENNDLKQGQNHLIELESQIKEYNWLPEADGELTVLECLENKCSRLRKNIHSLSLIIIDAKTVEADRGQFSRVLPADNELKKLIVLNDEISKIRAFSEKLMSLYSEIKKVATIAENERHLAGFDPDLSLLLSINEDIKKKQTKYDDLAGLLDEIETIQDNKIQAEDLRDKLQEEFDLVMPDVCPLCGK